MMLHPPTVQPLNDSVAKISVSDPYHFDVDPDPRIRIRDDGSGSGL